MNNTTPFNAERPWTAWEKMAFRFFFPFLLLQILTENFMGNWFGRTLFIWELGEKIFVPPCLWLNNHLFHFKYIPQTWTTFSGALHTIRDTIYLLLSCLICVLWTVFDKKRTSYRKLHYWFSRCLVIALSCIVFSYGIIKVFPVQMLSPSIIGLHTPVGDLSPFELLWTTFGYGKPYQVFTGFFEMAGAVLVLFNRTRVAGLLIIVSMMLNVIVLNYTFQVGVLITSFYILLIALFLLAPYTTQLLRFLFTKQPAALVLDEYIPRKNFKTTGFKIIATGLIVSSFVLNIQSAYNLYVRMENSNRSRQYSLVKNYIVDNDTLKLIENDALRWRIWSERVMNNKIVVTIAAMRPGATSTYTIERDTVAHMLTMHPLNQDDTASLNFNYRNTDGINWWLEGIIRQKSIKIELQRIKPDTTINLLKAKRTIVIFDDESDHE